MNTLSKKVFRETYSFFILFGIWAKVSCRAASFLCLGCHHWLLRVHGHVFMRQYFIKIYKKLNLSLKFSENISFFVKKLSAVLAKVHFCLQHFLKNEFFWKNHIIFLVFGAWAELFFLTVRNKFGGVVKTAFHMSTQTTDENNLQKFIYYFIVFGPWAWNFLPFCR